MLHNSAVNKASLVILFVSIITTMEIFKLISPYPIPIRPSNVEWWSSWLPVTENHFDYLIHCNFSLINDMTQRLF